MIAIHISKVDSAMLYAHRQTPCEAWDELKSIGIHPDSNELYEKTMSLLKGKSRWKAQVNLGDKQCSFESSDFPESQQGEALLDLMKLIATSINQELIRQET